MVKFLSLVVVKSKNSMSSHHLVPFLQSVIFYSEKTSLWRRAPNKAPIVWGGGGGGLRGPNMAVPVKTMHSLNYCWHRFVSEYVGASEAHHCFTSNRQGTIGFPLKVLLSQRIN